MKITQIAIKDKQEILARIEKMIEEFPESTLTSSLKSIRALALQDLNFSKFHLNRELLYDWLGNRTVAYIKVDGNIFKISFGTIQLDRSDDIKVLDNSPPNWLREYARQFI